MAKRTRRGLGSTGCKVPVPFEDDPPIEKCGSTKTMTLCVGDRVQRKPVGGKTFKAKGTVLGIQMGADNKGRKQLSARVCYDGAERGELAYPYLFAELKKL